MDGELREEVVEILNNILEQELAGVVRYAHYSFVVFGFSRIPIVHWMRAQAQEALDHAYEAGELITQFGAYPSLALGPLPDSHQTDIAAMLRESLESEEEALSAYKRLLACAEGRSVLLEEYARRMIFTEERHAAEVDKMLRRPGELGSVSATAGEAL